MRFKVAPGFKAFETWKCIIIIAILYAIFILSGKYAFQSQHGNELRIAAFMPLVVGLLWGVPGAIGAFLGNFLAACIYGSAPLSIFLGSVCNFVFSYVGHRLWFCFNNNNALMFIFDSNSFVKFFLVASISSTVASALICCVANIAYGTPIGNIAYNIFASEVLFSICLGMPVLICLLDLSLVGYVPAQQKGRFFQSKHIVSIATFICFLFLLMGNREFPVQALVIPVFSLGLALCAYLAVIPCDYSSNKETISIEPLGKRVVHYLLLLWSIVIVWNAFFTSFHTRDYFGGLKDTSYWHFVLRDMWYFLLVMLVINYVILWYIEKGITKRIQQISSAARSFVSTRELHKQQIDDVEQQDEISELAQTFVSMENSTISYINDYTSMLKEKENFIAQLEIAKNIQLSTLPNVEQINTELKGYKLYSELKTGKKVASVMSVCLPIDENHLAIGIGDSEAKGVPVALFMMEAYTVVKSCTAGALLLDPSKILFRVNKILEAKNTNNMSITLWLGILELSTGKLCYANSGHCLPLLVEKTGVTCLPEVEGSPLGISSNPSYGKRVLIMPRDSNLQLNAQELSMVFQRL